MKKIHIDGIELDVSSDRFQDNHNSPFYEKAKTIEISTRRDSTRIKLDCDDDDVLELVYEDGTSWITSAKHLEEIFSEADLPKKRGRGAFVIPKKLSVQSGKRGIGDIALKVVKHFVKKKISKELTGFKKDIGKSFDKKRMPKPGLYRVSPEFKLLPFDRTKEPKDPNYLLFIHGFISSTLGSFYGMAQGHQTVLWNSIKSEYGDNILAYDHYTVSVSVIDNAIDLLKQMPDNSVVEILSHSRGGLIADLLTRCSKDNKEFFTDKEIASLPPTEKKSLKALNKLAGEKNIEIKRVVRVGCPARGTYLLSERLDRFVNGVLSALGTLGGPGVEVVVTLVKTFLLDIIAAKSDPNTFPGVAGMVPDSDYMTMINAPSNPAEGMLMVVEGDAEFGRNWKQALAVIFTNLYYRTGNDFVVNTNSMRFGALRSSGVHVFKSKDSNTNHFRYFKNLNSQGAILRALFWNGQGALPEFSFLSSAELIRQNAASHSRSRGDHDQEEHTEPVEDLVDILFANAGRNAYREKSDLLTVSVTHGDLKFSDHPVMVGHFDGDGIVSAESAINGNLGNALTDHYFLGNYPAFPKDNLTIFRSKNNLKGALVIGLGEKMNFTEYSLRKSVENGIIAYSIAHRNRDCADTEEERPTYLGITSLCIGSGYGSLPMDMALTAILFGISNANDKIKELNADIENRPSWAKGEKLIPVTNIQIVDYYEHKARQAFFSLLEIEQNNYNLNLNIVKPILKTHGGQKKMEFTKDQTWWHNLVIEHLDTDKKLSNQGIRFLSSSGRAKVDVKNNHFSKKIVKALIRDFSVERRFNRELSNTLFQLLVPNGIKGILRNQSNILLKMDLEMAKFPWEMIHDKDYDEQPAFVNTGIVRQLLTRDNDSLEKMTTNNTALIIGDPVYAKYGSLPGAQQEAEDLNELLTNNGGWKINLLVNKRLIENATALMNTKFKLLHVAGHGVYDEETGEAGIVMEDTVIDSVFLKKLPHFPEFAFINCCYSGDIKSGFEETYRGRYEIAASIGVQLISMGVHAVVITGWAVDDDAAAVFAEKFYEQMLQGETFGRATQLARKMTYEEYPDDNTWGAYQCYGDPWYRLVREKNGNNHAGTYYEEEQVLTDLYNLKSETIKKWKKKILLKSVQKILDKAVFTNLDSAAVYENIAAIYVDLDELDRAMEMYSLMLKHRSAKYSMKGLEQFCNSNLKNIISKAKRTALKKIEDSKGHKNDKDLKIKIAKKTQRELIRSFERLLEISPSSERYNLIGSAYKRLSVEFDGREKRFLKEMINSYQSGLDMLPKDNYLQFIYPVTNLLQGQFYLDRKKAGIKIDDEFMPVLEVLDLLEKEVKLAKKNKNYFFDDIAQINLMTTRLLFVKDLDEVEKLKKEIIEKYNSEYGQTGTLKNLRSEQEQFDFLKRMMIRYLPKHKNWSAKIKALSEIEKTFIDLLKKFDDEK